MNWWKIGAAVAVLGAGGVALGSYLEYREVQDQVEPLREANEQARQRGEALAENIAHLDSVWAERLDSLDAERDSLARAAAAATSRRYEAEEAADLVADSLEQTLANLRQAVRPGLEPVVETAEDQLVLLQDHHRQERVAADEQVSSLAALLDQARVRRNRWRTRSDSLVELAETRLERALAAEQERDVWQSKAKWDLLGDGPQALLHAGIGIGVWEGVQLLVGG